MTKNSNGGNNSGADPVGRGRPPKDCQWPKGTSGNPKGRPKKMPAAPQKANSNALILAEADRVITLTEGGKPVSMSTEQAVLRAMVVAALKGNSHAQRSLMQMVNNARAQEQVQKDRNLRAALLLQIELDAKRTDWLRQGRDEQDMLNHPSDIEIDSATGEVKHFLIFTEEQRAARAKLIAFRDYQLEQIARSEIVAAEDEDDAVLQQNRELALAAVIRINEHLPSRHRRLPPLEEPSIEPNSSPEELSKALMQAVVERLNKGGR